MTTEVGDPIPRNYDEWKHCIEHWCGLRLTPQFINTRITALNDLCDEHTQRIIESYGEGHYRRLFEWFKRAQEQTQSS